MNVIIVDDENIIIEDLKLGIDWQRLNISNIYEASTIALAKDIFRNADISIMLCDIEMPHGNGLELLTWVKENYSSTEAIFLTCHADFNYAIEAIRKGSFDYLLKPVSFLELEEVIAKAIRKIESKSLSAQYIQIGSFWNRYQPVVSERLWIDILERNIPTNNEDIVKAASERNIPMSDSMLFLMIFIKVRRFKEEHNFQDEKQIEYLLKKMIDEQILLQSKHGITIQSGRWNFYTILSLDSYDIFDKEDLRRKCAELISKGKELLNADLNCYIGEESFVCDIPEQTDKLVLMDSNNIVYENKVFYVSEYFPQVSEYKPPDFGIWTTLLAKFETDNLFGLICDYIDVTFSHSGCDVNALRKFQFDFMQFVLTFLKSKNIPANRLLSDLDDSVDYFTASKSIIDFKVLIKTLLNKVRFIASINSIPTSISERAKHYISQNLNQDLSRTDIANHLHINADYFTRIFKKETGLSIPDFIMQEKLKTAKEMISKTDMSISSIASSLGYTNFSYFSKLFKDMFGINPSSYKGTKIEITKNNAAIDKRSVF